MLLVETSLVTASVLDTVLRALVVLVASVNARAAACIWVVRSLIQLALRVEELVPHANYASASSAKFIALWTWDA